MNEDRNLYLSDIILIVLILMNSCLKIENICMIYDKKENGFRYHKATMIM